MAQQLNGAGASFPAPVYNEMFNAFQENTGVAVNYQSIGSGGGVEQFTAETVDFGASDAYLSEEEMTEAGGNPLHIATVGGSVVFAYSLEGVDGQIRLTPDVATDIFLGEITNWSDPALQDINPDVQLPDSEITVVHRSDGSGTTDIFSSYLASVSDQWESEVGAGRALSWPTGVGAEGNEGVAGQISQTPNSIGYVELAYATENDIPYAMLENQAGEFVEPSLETARAAVAGADIPDDLRITISETNPSGENAYPITGLTWILVRQEQPDLAVCRALTEMLWYVTHDGQQFAPDLQYVQIPEKVVRLDEEKIMSITANGEQCYQGSNGGGGGTTE